MKKIMNGCRNIGFELLDWIGYTLTLSPMNEGEESHIHIYMNI